MVNEGFGQLIAQRQSLGIRCGQLDFRVTLDKCFQLILCDRCFATSQNTYKPNAQVQGTLPKWVGWTG